MAPLYQFDKVRTPGHHLSGDNDEPCRRITAGRSSVSCSNWQGDVKLTGFPASPHSIGKLAAPERKLIEEQAGSTVTCLLAQGGEPGFQDRLPPGAGAEVKNRSARELVWDQDQECAGAGGRLNSRG